MNNYETNAGVVPGT